MAPSHRRRGQPRSEALRPSLGSARKEERKLQPQQTKAPTGIQGFDRVSNGGLPRGRTSLVIGGPGAGKTVFALQTLVNGARNWSEPGIFVAFEENSRQIIANAASFGWDLPALENEKLFFLDARMSLDTITAGEFDLAGLLASLEAKAEDMGARRIVFDSIDVLLALLDDPMSERREIYRVHDWLSQGSMTGIVTARIATRDLLHSERYAFMQFMADCVVLLTHRLEDRVSLRTLRIAKYRGSSFAENAHPLLIGPQAMDVGIAEQLELAYEAPTERISSGIERLDHMLSGGYYRGSTVLVSGAPGTAKSTLCGNFVEAACQRGERALYVSFDESAGEIQRNLASVNVQLAPHVESGLLRIYSARAEARSADQHLMRLKSVIAEHQPACMAIDPLSAMIKAGGDVASLSMAERLLSVTKSRGITLVMTSLLEGSNPETEATPLDISTIADVWIHLSYVVTAGERNRALSIVKSRGTAHSNQVRELVMSAEGVTLTDVYTAGGEVLMGTLRWEKEAEARAERGRREAEFERREKDHALAEAEAQARMEALKREIEALRAESADLKRERWLFAIHRRERQEDIQRLRQGEEIPSGDEERPNGEPPLTGESGEGG
jgi:circadian clock protein KaiC